MPQAIFSSGMTAVTENQAVMARITEVQRIVSASHALLASCDVSGQPIASDLKFQGMRASISDAGQP